MPPTSACSAPKPSPDESTFNVVRNTSLYQLADPELADSFKDAVQVLSTLQTRLDRLATKDEQANQVEMIKALDLRLTNGLMQVRTDHSQLPIVQLVAALARLESLLPQLHNPHTPSVQPTCQSSERHQPMTPVSLASSVTPVTDSKSTKQTSTDVTQPAAGLIEERVRSNDAPATPTDVFGPLNYLSRVQTSTSLNSTPLSAIDPLDEIEETQTDSLESVTTPGSVPSHCRAKKKTKRIASLDLRPITRSISNENRSRSLSTGASIDKDTEKSSSSSSGSLSSQRARQAKVNTGGSKSLVNAAFPTIQEVAHSPEDKSSESSTIGSVTSIGQEATDRTASFVSNQSSQRTRSVGDCPLRSYSAFREFAKQLETKSRSKQSSPAASLPYGARWGKKRFLELGDDSDEDDGGHRGDEMSLLSA